jgi:acetyl-CoA C-acetyltransferase
MGVFARFFEPFHPRRMVSLVRDRGTGTARQQEIEREAVADVAAIEQDDKYFAPDALANEDELLYLIFTPSGQAPGGFAPRPQDWGLGAWYGETGLMLTTQFFTMKIPRYMAEYGISPATLARVAAKAFRNGCLNPNAWRRKPLSEEEILGSRMVSHPLTQFMFCSPGEGAVALVLARGARLRDAARVPVYLRSVALRTRRFGSFEVFSPSIAGERRRGRAAP